MIRGTTPTIEFTIPFDSSQITVLSVAFAQSGTVILEKHLSDCACSDKKITVVLTEADTLALSATTNVQIQIRCIANSLHMATQIFDVPVYAILKDGALT